jgi:hypothetical protein
MVNSDTDNCQKLRTLHNRITNELKELRENEELAENEGIANPIQTASVIKSLQKVLSNIDIELNKCSQQG